MARIPKEQKNYKDSIPRMARWLLCQKIGKVFYESAIADSQLDQIKELFERSDFLKEEIFIQRLK